MSPKLPLPIFLPIRYLFPTRKSCFFLCKLDALRTVFEERVGHRTMVAMLVVLLGVQLL